MKLSQFVLPLIICTVTTPAVAAEDIKKPITQWTCAEFLSIDEAFRPKVVYAATAYSKAHKPESVIDINGTETVTPVIIDNCKKTPQSRFVRELKAAWNKVEADAKADMKKLEKKL